MTLSGLLFAIACFLPFSQDPPPLSDTQIDEIVRKLEQEASLVDHRIKRIEEECSKITNHDWAGAYVGKFGLHDAVQLSVGPQSGVAFRHTECFGVRQNLGMLREERSRFQIDWQLSDKDDHFCAAEYLLIRWGRRRYLIPRGDALEFVAAIQMKLEPRRDQDGWFLLRQGDERIDVVGDPTFPPGFETILSMKWNVQAAISFVGEPTIKTHKYPDGSHEMISQRATLDAGEDKGVQPGMEFETPESVEQGVGSPFIRVVSVSKRESQVEVVADRASYDQMVKGKGARVRNRIRFRYEMDASERSK